MIVFIIPHETSRLFEIQSNLSTEGTKGNTGHCNQMAFLGRFYINTRFFLKGDKLHDDYRQVMFVESEPLLNWFDHTSPFVYLVNTFPRCISWWSSNQMLVNLVSLSSRVRLPPCTCRKRFSKCLSLPLKQNLCIFLCLNLPPHTFHQENHLNRRSYSNFALLIEYRIGLDFDQGLPHYPPNRR